MKRVFRRTATPLAFYYAITIALPLANGAVGPAFLAHALVVLAIPPVLTLLFCATRAGVLAIFRCETWSRNLPRPETRAA